MAIQIKEPLNLLPVKTYRWLKLNELHLQSPIEIELQPYLKAFLATTVDNNIMTKLTANHSSLLDQRFGVSQELVDLALSDNNAGCTIRIPRGVTVNKPVEISYLLDHDNNIVIDNNLIVAEENSSVTIIMDYSTIGLVTAFHNGVTQIKAAPGANVTLIKIQRMNDQSLHFDSHLAEVGYGATVNYIQVELGSKLSVTNYINNLGNKGTANLDSIYFGDGNRRIDINYLMNHQGIRSESNIRTYGALKDYAHKSFKGTIDFKRGSRMSKGSETEYVTLLDKTVKSEAVPLLLAAEDDVEGEHAASAGKINEDQLFYLMSRGFDRVEAIKAIVEASFNPVIAQIPNLDLQAAISTEIHRRLSSG